jgi:hypothetical protein
MFTVHFEHAEFLHMNDNTDDTFCCFGVCVCMCVCVHICVVGLGFDSGLYP